MPNDSGCQFEVEAMTCASCVARVDKALRSVPGVLSARANLTAETAEVTVLAGAVTSQTLAAQVMVNRVAAWFVPVVLVLALATVVVWLAFGPSLAAGVSVLIIACLCAMGLAVPTSIVVGKGRAAEIGVLFRKGQALQHLDGVSAVAFDKTGTLTWGAPEMTDLIAAGGMARNDVLAAGAALERRSEHPFGQAFLRDAEGLTKKQRRPTLRRTPC